MQKENGNDNGRAGESPGGKTPVGGKDLIRRTRAFARRVIKLYIALPRETLAQVLGKQVLRAGTSVGANYREANRARSKAEFVSKIGECLKEADETLYWLELLSDENILPSRRLGPLLQESNDLVCIFCDDTQTSKRRVISKKQKMKKAELLKAEGKNPKTKNLFILPSSFFLLPSRVSWH